MDSIIQELKAERLFQDGKWGVQNRPILDPILLHRDAKRMTDEYEIPSEERAKSMVEIHAHRGDLTYMHILVEEVSEAASCGSNAENLRKAVIIAMIECLDRNGR